MMCFASCNGGKKAETAETTPVEEPAAEAAAPEYKLLDLPTVDLSAFPKDNDGWITLFDGKTLNGWRGYDREDVPAAWVVDDGAIHIKGSGNGEAGAKDGGDLIFAHKFSNFELEFEWKVDKGANSGVFIMIQEVEVSLHIFLLRNTRYWIMKTIQMLSWALTVTVNHLLCMI